MNLCGGRLVGSMPLPGSNAARKPAVAALQFPAGLRVLVVDDDPTCLKILEKMLQACQYEVTKCDRAEYALNELRRNKNGFDIVLSDVHMPDMDGFKLLEHIGLEMDLPVIMMSADDSKNVVMKGVTHGACDYLIKPVRIEALKNIWQHVVRKKKKKDWKDLEQSGSLDDGDSAQKQEDLEQSGSFDDGNLKSSKRKGDDEDNEDKDDSSSMKKPRVVWSVELHQQFVAAVNQLGIDKAVPKKILEMMNVPGLTRENVASHLQKYRLYLRRLSGVSQHQGGLNASFMSPQDAAFASMSPLGGIDLQTLAFAGQLPGQNISGYQPGLARPGIKPGMSMPFIEQRNLFSFEASKLRFAEGQHLQQLSNNANKQMNLLHGIPTTMELKQLGGFHQSTQPLGSLNMHASSQGSQSNPILVQMVQPQVRPGQLMNESSIGSQMSQIQSSNRQTVRSAGMSAGVLPRSGIADSSQATSYGSLDFSVNQPRSSFPLGSPPAVTTSEGLIQEEVSSNGKRPRTCGPNYNMFNELPPQKPQDWRSSALSYSIPQHTPSGPKIVDVSPSVLVNQGFSASQRPGQFVNSCAANNTASLPGTGVLQQTSGAQTVNNPLINNAPSKVKTERDQELSSVNDLYPYQFAQDDLMSAILKQQEGIEPVPGDFDFEGFTMDNIPGVAN